MRRFGLLLGALAAVISIGLSVPGRATVYDVTLPSSSILSSTDDFFLLTGEGVFGVSEGYLSPFYSFKPRDTVNFGSVLLGASISGDQYGDIEIYLGAVSLRSFSSGFAFRHLASVSNEVGIAGIFSRWLESTR
jgi:hypothetical protein